MGVSSPFTATIVSPPRIPAAAPGEPPFTDPATAAITSSTARTRTVRPIGIGRTVRSFPSAERTSRSICLSAFSRTSALRCPNPRSGVPPNWRTWSPETRPTLSAALPFSTVPTMGNVNGEAPYPSEPAVTTSSVASFAPSQRGASPVPAWRTKSGPFAARSDRPRACPSGASVSHWSHRASAPAGGRRTRTESFVPGSERMATSRYSWMLRTAFPSTERRMSPFWRPETHSELPGSISPTTGRASTFPTRYIATQIGKTKIRFMSAPAAKIWSRTQMLFEPSSFGSPVSESKGSPAILTYPPSGRSQERRYSVSPGRSFRWTPSASALRISSYSLTDDPRWKPNPLRKEQRTGPIPSEKTSTFTLWALARMKWPNSWIRIRNPIPQAISRT